MSRLYTERHFGPGNFYHVLNKSFKKRNIFLKPKDYGVFLRIIQKSIHFDKNTCLGKLNRTGSKEPVEIMVASLLPNHYHLIALENESKALTGFMSSLLLKYWHHLRRKYGWKGQVCNHPFRAKRLVDEAQFIEAYNYVRWNAIDAGEGITWINPRCLPPIKFYRRNIVSK
jgi:REP element-mobilizing transposase RayT